MPVAVQMGEPRGGDDVAPAVTTPVASGRRKQKHSPYSHKTSPSSRSAAAASSTPSAPAARQPSGESPSGSTSTATTTTSPTSAAAPSSTWTLYDNPCFCSSHFFPDQHRHRRRHHHRKPITTPEKPSPSPSLSSVVPMREPLGTVLERERAMREEAEAMAEALRVELARERRRREEAEQRAGMAAEEVARWKAEVERVQDEVRAAREAATLQEQRARVEMAEVMLRFEDERRRLQMQLQVRTPPAACGGNGAVQSDRSKDQQRQQQQQQNKVQHQVASPHGTTPAPPGLSPATTPTQPLKQPQPRRDASPAPVENPHIRRGIIGFVEFPRVVGRSRGATTKPAGPPKLECQKAQLRVLLKGAGGGKVAPVSGFPSSATPPHNLVM